MANPCGVICNRFWNHLLGGHGGTGNTGKPLDGQCAFCDFLLSRPQALLLMFGSFPLSPALFTKDWYVSVKSLCTIYSFHGHGSQWGPCIKKKWHLLSCSFLSWRNWDSERQSGQPRAVQLVGDSQGFEPKSCVLWATSWCPLLFKVLLFPSIYRNRNKNTYSHPFAFCCKLCMNSWVRHPLTHLLSGSLSPEYIQVNKWGDKLGIQAKISPLLQQYREVTWRYFPPNFLTTPINPTPAPGGD